MTSPMARLQQKTQAAVTTGSAGSTGIPCAMVLRFISRSPPVATVVREINPATLAPASERQDHTTSPSALGHVRLTCPPRPPHPRLTCRDDRAYAPLHRGGMRESIVVI